MDLSLAQGEVKSRRSCPVRRPGWDDAETPPKAKPPEPADCEMAYAVAIRSKVIAALEEQGQAAPVASKPVAIAQAAWWTSEPPWVARPFGGFYSIELAMSNRNCTRHVHLALHLTVRMCIRSKLQSLPLNSITGKAHQGRTHHPTSHTGWAFGDAMKSAAVEALTVRHEHCDRTSDVIGT